jgi:ribosome biogenesis GTPase
MTPELHDRLRPIGFNNHVSQTLAGLGPAASAMRIVEVHRDLVELHDGDQAFRAHCRPPLARDLAAQGEHLAVGDWVLTEHDFDGGLWVTARITPLTQLVRRNSEGARQCLVSNVDTALLVMGLDGDFNLRRLERYLALVSGAGVCPVVVLTKLDAVANADARIDAARDRIPTDTPVLALDARQPSARAALASYLAPGQTLVTLGSSGAGKSTLTNTLLCRAEQATGAVRAHDSRGRHTTTTRSLHMLPDGACFIDTP